MRTDAELFDEIEERLIENRPLTEILRLLLLLGGRLGSSELQAWAREQLEGFDLDDDLPESRTVAAPIFVNAVVGNHLLTHQHLSAMNVPEIHGVQLEETVKLTQSIDGIEQSVEHLTNLGESVQRIAVPGWELFAAEIDKGQFGQHTNLMYREIHINEYKRIVEAARTEVVELLSEFRKSAKASRKLITGKQADNIVQNVTISGGDNSVQISHGGKNRQVIGAEKSHGWWNAWGKVATIITIGTATIALVTWGVTSLT